MDDGLRPRVPHVPPRNHVLLAVHAGGGGGGEEEGGGPCYLADVGFGVHGPRGVLPMEDGADCALGTTRYQLRARPVPSAVATLNLLELWAIDPALEGWTRLYAFNRSQRISATDIVMANHYTATHPTSSFATQVWGMMRRGNCAYILLGDRLTVIRYRNGQAAKELRNVATPAALRAVARDCLAIDLSPLQAARVARLNDASPDRLAQRPLAPLGVLEPVRLGPLALLALTAGAALAGAAALHHLQRRGVSLEGLWCPFVRK